MDLILARSSPDLFKPSHRWWDGAAWQEEPLDNVLFSEPVAVSWGANRLDVFQNFAGHLWQKTWNGSWSAWVDLDAALPLGAPTLSAPPAAYSTGPDTLEIFALRSGGVWRRHFAAGAWSAWEAVIADHLELDAPDFDAEWEWIGSYSTDRAATFVRLYPENLLLPSLVTHRTPAFAQARRSIPPDQAAIAGRCLPAGAGVFSYLRDVGFLGCACDVPGADTPRPETPCKTAAPLQKKSLLHVRRTKWGKNLLVGVGLRRSVRLRPVLLG